MLKLIFPVLKAKICRRLDRLAVPYKINLHITYSCNSRCKTCFIWKKYRKRPELKNKELKASDWKEFFKKMGDRLYWISISGGEPFLREDLAEIISSMDMKNLCIMSINTNGQLPEKTYNITRETLEIIPENTKVFLAVSLLGFENTHNFVSGKKNAFEKSKKTYEKLKSLQSEYKNFYLERELVVNKHNLNELEEITDSLNREKIPFTFTFAQESKYYDNTGKEVGLSPQEKQRVAEILRTLRIPLYQKADIMKNIFKKIAIKFFEKGEIPKCYSSWCSVRIDPYGNVYPCIMRDEVIGNLVENGMDLEKTMLKSKKLKRIQKEIKNKECSCWTPCEAYQNIVQNFHFSIQTLKTVFKSTKKVS
ncbi:MAG: radical SAM protein [Candidatus Aenigmarchaeota archaeon]|nr:radical SAM protein [Candidatus Aenigmarchaeota archaeon]